MYDGATMKPLVLPKWTTARLRARHQLTLPAEIVAELGVGEGDRFGVTLADGIVHLEPIRKSYFGVFRDLWPDTWMEDLRAERDAWARREEAWTPHEPS